MGNSALPVKILLILFLATNINISFSKDSGDLGKVANAKMKGWQIPVKEWRHIARPETDSVVVDKDQHKITLYFKPSMVYFPFREEHLGIIMKSVTERLGRKFRKYSVEIRAGTFNIDELIPNYYRKSIQTDIRRLPVKKPDNRQVVRRISGYVPEEGLYGNSIALWHSHGYYFEMSLDRWEWQRARLFGTVEDISVMAYVLPYLTPMLENAGANVFLPRERDIQINEVIVDNDRSTGNSEVVLHLNGSKELLNDGFTLVDTLFPGINPFHRGTSFKADGDSARFIPDIPETGEYAVYIAYPAFSDNSADVLCSVTHSGGRTDFKLDQTIGGSTWIYLGTFRFLNGKDQNSGSLTIMKAPGSKGYFTVDAVKFGGGMGNTARRPSAEITRNRQSALDTPDIPERISGTETVSYSWKLSGVPRYLEGSRYWLQYAGMPDTLVYSPTLGKNDYIDDYQSRSAWVNNLIAPTDNSGKGGKGIPIDISLAFHTDAGITPDDSIIGTLAIYSTASNSGRFTDQTSRLASRDFSDIVQTYVVEDIRKQFNPQWTRRGIWDRSYYEARVPEVPALLLELLSHQNLADQKFGLDPRFRFQVARSAYKGITRYLSFTEGKEYVIQPLPVSHFAIAPVSGRKIRLSWRPVPDTLEPTAIPDRYILYSRTGENGFDNGIIVKDTTIELEVKSFDEIYSYKVTAANKGGESFPSEILTVGLKETGKTPVLIVNGFDRICAPEFFDNDGMAGVAWWNDRGVADRMDIVATGDQYDFDRKSPWLDDDSPGWGASYNNMSGKVIAGNTFDFSYIHGKAILNSGHSFFSVSDEHFCSPAFNVGDWKIADFIFGEEKSTPWFGDSTRMDFRIYSPEFINQVTRLSDNGAGIFLSGSYIGSDLKLQPDSSAIKFASEVLHFSHRTGHSVTTGGIYATDLTSGSFIGKYDFNTRPDAKLYAAEAPDAIEPTGKSAQTSFRYSENNASAGVSFSGNSKSVILGFPFETISDEYQRNTLMKQVLLFLEKD